MATETPALARQSAPCPHCNLDVFAARQAGHEYCPRCGFEFGICRHCGADCWESVCSPEICCRACGKHLHPDDAPLPDDAFWKSWRGETLRGIKFILSVVTGIAIIMTGLQVVLAWIFGR